MYKYIAYHNRTCVTGRNLFNWLTENSESWRRINRARRFKYMPEYLLRWGNSTIDTPNGVKELNTKQAVNNASDKGRMIELLIEHGVSVPEFAEDNTPAFRRNRYDHIVYRPNRIEGDKYALKPVDKVKEYRVHVFNDRVIGVYEKEPNEGESGLIRKAENCRFRRVDRATENIEGVQPIAKQAVKALDMLFGGVDVIEDREGKLYVTEVNSAPALNTPNLARWGREIINYIEGSE